jgi:lysylphosphatidylglycerol synthetase-like protein (DUF2156 family)
MTLPAEATRNAALLRRGRGLEAATLAWNLVGIVILAVAALRAHSVALAGFGLDSLIEIGASTVVLWELSGTGEERQRRALRLIAAAFLALAGYLTVQTIVVFATGYHPQHSPRDRLLRAEGSPHDLHPPRLVRCLQRGDVTVRPLTG